MIKLTEPAWADVRNVNDMINNNVEYVLDKHNYNKSDHWAFPSNYKGDCEDFALAKQAFLAAKGIVSWLVCCWSPRGTYHVVLAVESDKGVKILDNHYLAVMRFEDLRYKWDKIERPDGWYKIRGAELGRVVTGPKVKAPKGYIAMKEREAKP